MKKFIKSSIWLLIVGLCVVMILTFSFTGCKKSTAVTTVAETTAAETTAAVTTAAEQPYAGTEIGITVQKSLQEDSFFELFTQKTGIKVKQFEQPADWAAQQQIIITYSMEGAPGVDIIQTAPAITWTLQNAGTYLSLDDLFTKEQIDTWPINYVKEECYGTDGHLYQIPAQYMSMGFMVNKKLIEEAGAKIPTNWDELLDTAQKTTKADGSQYGIDIAGFTGGHLFNNMLLFVKEAGGNFTDMTDPKTIQGLKFLYDLVKTYKVVDPKMPTMKNCQDIGAHFVAGKSAMIIDFIGCFTGVDMPMEGFDKGNMVIVPPFSGPAGAAFPGGAMGFAISKFSKNPGAAKEFMKYAMSDEGQLAMGLSVPSTSTALADTSKTKDPASAEAQKLYLKAAVSKLVFGKWSSDLAISIDADFNAALSGQISFEEALKNMDKKIKETMVE